MKVADVLLRLDAFRRGAPIPIGETFPWPRATDDDRMIVVFVRMAGESVPWGFAAGAPGREPVIASVAEPRNPDELARLIRRFGELLLPHLPHPDQTTPEEQAEIKAIARRRQLWVPGPTHLSMLHFLDFRFSRAREGESGMKDLHAIGRAAGWLFRESTRPGQTRVFDLTRCLRDAFAVPAEDVRQAHLGFLMAWIGSTGTREERAHAAHLAEAMSVGVTMRPELERDPLSDLVKRWNEHAKDPIAAAPFAAQIQAVLTTELQRRFQLAEAALALLDADGRPPNPELTALLDLGADEFEHQYWNTEHKHLAPVLDPNAPRFRGNDPETDWLPSTAAARFFAHQQAAELADTALVHGDPSLIRAAIDAGNALRGTIDHIVNEGTKRAVIPVWTVRCPAEGLLRLREDSKVCVAGLPKRTGVIRAIEVEAGVRTVTVEIDGWKLARADEGVPAAVDPALEGTEVTLVETGMSGLLKQKATKVWDNSVAGAWLTHSAPLPERAESPPFAGDLLRFVEALGGR